MSDDCKSEKDIFLAALNLKVPTERHAFLEKACIGNPVMLKQIQALLKANEIEDGFLETPAFDIDVTSVTSSITEGPGTVIGRYKLLEKIGEGGMAVVYMAEQEQPIHRKVALKIIKLGMDTRQVIARFEAERQALAMMDHPNIAKVHDAGATEAGRPYFVMELVTGVSITQYCDRNNVNAQERLGLFIQVCQAVQHAHLKGIIHRDIKPSNVLVAQHEGTAVPKVIDFGIAKATNQRLTEKTLFTRYAHIVGTPAYMSPEQAELSDIDTRSDIYSLGVLLYELLTGTTPFSEAELREAGYLEMQRMIREQEPPKPSTKLTTLGETLIDIAKHRGATPDLLTRTVRGDLDWIVMKALDKARDRRYDTVSALVLDMQLHLRNEPVLARAPSPMYRLRKFIQRNQSQIVAGVVIGVLCVALVMVLSLRKWHDLKQRIIDATEHKSAMYQANIDLTQGKPGNALAEIERLVDSPHVGADARRLHARLMGLARQNVTHYSEELESDPWNWGARLKRAQNSYYLGDMDEVERDMARYRDQLTPPPGTEEYERQFERLQAQQQASGFVFSTPVNLGPPVNTVYAQYGAHISPDGLILHFSDGGPWASDPDGYGGGDLWMSRRESLDGSWEKPRNLGPVVNSPHPDGYPCLSGDGLSLYFFSDRPEGYGEPDLYVSNRRDVDGPWGNPMNLGLPINSATGDFYPHISADNLTLTFSTNRSGIGDLYMATRSSEDEPFHLAENFGPPVNTEDGSESCPWISRDGCLLFFTRTGRKGIGGIFLARRESPQHPWSEPIHLGTPVCIGGISGSSFTADGRRFYFHGSHVGRFGNTDIWESCVLQAPEGFPGEDRTE